MLENLKLLFWSAKPTFGTLINHSAQLSTYGTCWTKFLEENCWFPTNQQYKAPILDQYPINNLYMIHVMVLSAKVRRNEKLRLTLDISVIFGSIFGFNIHNLFNLRNETTDKIAIHFISNIFLHQKITPPYTSPYLSQNLLNDWLWGLLLYIPNTFMCHKHTNATSIIKYNLAILWLLNKQYKLAKIIHTSY